MTNNTVSLRSAYENERGGALVLALLVLSVLFVSGGAFLTVSLIEARIVENEVAGAVTFNVAEAGLEHAIVELVDQDVNALLTAGGNLFTNQDLADGSYSVDVFNNISPIFPLGTVPVDPGGATNDTDEILLIASTGVYQTATRTVRVVVRRDDILFDVAIFGQDGLTTTGNAILTGTIGTNGNMNLSNTTTVTGDAEAGGTINDTSVISGTSTQGAPPRTLDDTPCPANSWGPAPPGAGISLETSTGDLSITTNADVTFPGGMYYFHNFNKTGNGALHVAAGDTVDIYVSGSLDLHGQGIINDNNAAGDFQIWGCGADTSNWNIQSNITSYYTIYAPQHPINLDGNGVIHGSLIGGDFSWPANGEVHYDSSLVNARAYSKVPGTWSEMIF